MSCAVCGDPYTVRSHIFPRAFAHEIRADCKDLTILVSNAERPKFSQSGDVDTNLLCASHEAITGELDCYGVAFVRRVRAMRGTSTTSLSIDNPEPSKLLRFACSIVWRSVISPLGGPPRSALGGAKAAVAGAIFEEAPLRAQLFIASVAIKHDERDILAIMAPQRSREAGAWLWRFTLNGCFFALFLGSPSLRENASEARADQLRTPIIAHLPDLPATDWLGFAEVMSSIQRHPERR